MIKDLSGGGISDISVYVQCIEGMHMRFSW